MKVSGIAPPSGLGSASCNSASQTSQNSLHPADKCLFDHSLLLACVCSDCQESNQIVFQVSIVCFSYLISENSQKFCTCIRSLVALLCFLQALVAYR